jgi:hypothetical protein
MKTKLFALAALLSAFVVSVRAQTITNIETFSDWSGSGYTITANRIYAQTFTSVSAMQQMLYKFTSSNASSSSSMALEVKLVEWNPNALTAAASFGATVHDFGTQTITAPNSWTESLGSGMIGYDLKLDLVPTYGATGITLDPSKTYAMMMISTTGTPSGSGIGLAFTNDDSFAFGTAARQSTATAMNQDLGYDWGFTQTVVTVVPESSTIAAIAGALLVAGLVALRLRQRRQQALVPVTTN